jgi:hypothetical protein
MQQAPVGGVAILHPAQSVHSASAWQAVPAALRQVAGYDWPALEQASPSQHGLEMPHQPWKAPQQTFAVVPWYVVTFPQVSPEQHSLPAPQAVPFCLQQVPEDVSHASPAFWQHWEYTVHWNGWPVPEFSGSRHAPQVCAPVGPVQPSGAQQVVAALPATQEVPVPEQQVPGTPALVDVQIPLLHSTPSRQDQPSYRVASP